MHIIYKYTCNQVEGPTFPLKDMPPRLENSGVYHENILLLGFPGILIKLVLELHLMLPKGVYKVVVSCRHREVGANDY